MPIDPAFRFLVVESEAAQEREERRRSAGKSGGETFAATLGQLAPGCAVELVAPADDDEAGPVIAERLAGFDAVFLSGATIHVYKDSPEVRRLLDFVRAVLAGPAPSFGSCAGLQLAVAAAGGEVREAPRREAGIARRITRTAKGRDHPLLAGRGVVWDALVLRSDEVARLPDGATLLATSAAARVQAVEIKTGAGVFWGVQYHPELAPGELAAALRRSADELTQAGLARTPADVEAQAALLDELHRDSRRRDVQWRLGVDDEVAREERRRLELRNFIDHLVLPARERRRGGAA